MMNEHTSSKYRRISESYSPYIVASSCHFSFMLTKKCARRNRAVDKHGSGLPFFVHKRRQIAEVARDLSGPKTILVAGNASLSAKSAGLGLNVNVEDTVAFSNALVESLRQDFVREAFAFHAETQDLTSLVVPSVAGDLGNTRHGCRYQSHPAFRYR